MSPHILNVALFVILAQTAPRARTKFLNGASYKNSLQDPRENSNKSGTVPGIPEQLEPMPMSSVSREAPNMPA